MQENYVAAN